MIARQFGALFAALCILSVELPECSRVLLALAPFVVLAGWPGRQARATDEPGSARTAAAWVAIALPVSGLALRLDWARVAAPWVLLPNAAMGIALVAALAACAQRAAGRARFVILWSVLVPGLAILAWAWDHGTSAMTNWPLWSALSPLGWAASHLPLSNATSMFEVDSLGPWIGVSLLWAAAVRGSEP